MTHPGGGRAPVYRPCLEPLESRSLLSTAAHTRAVEDAAALPRSGPRDVILHDFGAGVVSDGYQPWGSLTLVRSGKPAVLFGVTLYGGAYGRGTIFMMDPDGSDYHVVHAFAGGTGDGANPYDDQLRQVGNVLYGTTLAGGPDKDGVIFRINTDGTGYTVIHSFTGATNDGAKPHSSPMPEGNVLIGMTTQGGANHQGAIYVLNDDGSGFHVVYSFARASGDQPQGYVVMQGSTLYGMTRLGGAANDGVIFGYNLATNQYSTLHTFVGGVGDGSRPDHGGLTVSGKWLYGLTSQGGRANDGVLFRISTTGAAFRVLHTFAPGRKNGVGPEGSLLLRGGALYGTSAAGGPANQGTVFRIGSSGGGFTVLHGFRGAPGDGASPVDNVLIYKGKLYGMTRYGGSIPTPQKRTGAPPFANGVVYALPLRG